jgi:protease I
VGSHNALNGRAVALLVAPRGTEERELTQPKEAAEDAGARVEVVSIKGGEAETVNSDLDPGDSYAIDRTLADAGADDYDALIVRGGTVGADTLRDDEDAVAFVGAFFEQTSPLPPSATARGYWWRPAS